MAPVHWPNSASGRAGSSSLTTAASAATSSSQRVNGVSTKRVPRPGSSTGKTSMVGQSKALQFSKTSGVPPAKGTQSKRALALECLAELENQRDGVRVVVTIVSSATHGKLSSFD